MTGMTQAWERLYLGSFIDAENLARLNPCRITTVLTLCPDPVRHRASGINYLHFPVDDERAIAVAQFDEIIDALWENIRRGKVLVHCVSGISRSPIMAAAWMHVVGYRNIEAALEEIAGLRPIIEPSSVLLKSVKEHLQ